MTYFSFLQIRWKTAICANYRKISYDAKKKDIINLLNDIPKFQIMSESCLRGNESSKKRRPSQYVLKVLGSGAHISNSLYVFTDHVRYLFNCGEGTQRLSVEHGMKLSKVQNIFVTYQSWKNIGGLLGCALTMQSMGIKEFNVYGPPGVEEILSATQSFMNLRKINIRTRTNNPRLTIDDDVMKVQFVPLYQESSINLHKNLSDTKMTELGYTKQDLVKKNDSNEQRCRANSISPDLNKLNKANQKDRSHSEVRSSNSKEKYALCYICETVDFLGTLNLDACVELGVPAGPLLGKLKNRENIYLENGNLVKWEDVTKNHAKSMTFIIVDCPTKQYLDALLSEPAFISYQFDCNEPASVVVHFTPPEVMNSVKYREWIGRFPFSTKHLRLNSDNSCLGNIATHRMQTKLNLLHPDIFPMLHDSSIPNVKDEHSGKIVKGQFTMYRHSNEENKVFQEKIKSDNDLDQKFSEREILCSREDPYEYISVPSTKSNLKIIKGRTTLGIQLYPPLDCEYFHNMCLDPIAFFKEAISIKDWDKELNELKNFIKELSESNHYKIAPDYPKILFLGTGSGAPYKTRNTSGILIYLNKNNLMLLDCGEGTYTQMLRLFGKEKLEKIFENLRIIYVSHPHADHHLGLITILNERKKIFKKKVIKERAIKVNPKECDSNYLAETSDLNNVLLLLPSPVQCWLHLYDQNYDSILENTEILLNSLVGKSENVLRSYLEKLNLAVIQTFPVQHCFQSYGITFTHSSGCKITYSGDTMPSEKLVEFGRNSNILIHEATFEDGMEIQAGYKKHSTLSQAIRVGEQMNAKFILLTHFSQRYSHLPYLPEQLPENVGIAFDNMLVNEKQLIILPKLTKFYKKLFADKIMELTVKQIKRSIREEQRNESLDSPPRKRKIIQ